RLTGAGKDAAREPGTEALDLPAVAEGSDEHDVAARLRDRYGAVRSALRDVPAGPRGIVERASPRAVDGELEGRGRAGGREDFVLHRRQAAVVDDRLEHGRIARVRAAPGGHGLADRCAELDVGLAEAVRGIRPFARLFRQTVELARGLLAHRGRLLRVALAQDRVGIVASDRRERGALTGFDQSVNRRPASHASPLSVALR